jgi:diguanylate cyclase
MTARNDAPKSATEIAKKVIVQTAQSTVPLTPQNFHVWYEYFLGHNEQLTSTIDALLASGDSFGKEIMEKLYEEHLDQNRAEILKEVQKETHKIFQNIFTATLSANDAACDYSGKMQAYGDKLKDAKDLPQIQNMLQEIIGDTHKMASSSRLLNQKLDEATSQIESLSQKLEKTEKEVYLDALTGLNNRKAFDLKLEEFCKGVKQDDGVFSVIMLDIDYFKKFNDQYGHQIGDEVLSLVGWQLRENLKGKDFPARYGGEEFVVLLPNTKMDQACIVAEHLREIISKRKLKIKKTGQDLGIITASLGVSQIDRQDSAESVLARADAALYLAKKSGRNTVKCETDLTVKEPRHSDHATASNQPPA